MIRLLSSIPKHVDLAFSGGVDSVAIAHFLQQGKRVVRLMHFNHGNAHSSNMEKFCLDFANRYNMEFVVGALTKEKPARRSAEDFWRQERYSWLRSVSARFITGHHLNDAAETWLWSAMHGTPKLIPFETAGAFRPFLLTQKSEFVSYANKHGLPVFEDPSNTDVTYMRNYIRENVLPHALHINPGLLTVIRKKYEEEHGRKHF